MSTPHSHTYTKDIASLRNKLRRTLAQGPNQLRIISDFDSTISSPTGPSSWCVIEDSEFLSDTYRARSKSYVDKYYPKEIDPTLTIAERSNWMIEWWTMAGQSLRDENITREKYQNILIAAQELIKFRQGVKDLFEQSHLLGVPLVIFSAGIGDIIDSCLIHHFSQYYLPDNPFYPIEHLPQLKSPGSTAPLASHLPTSPAEYGSQLGIPRTIYIIANHLNFDQDPSAESNHPFLLPDQPKTFAVTDIVSGFRTNAPIHVFNKHETLLMTAPYFEKQILPRKNAIVLGDSLGDALMVALDSPDNVIRIGFLQTNPGRNKTKKTHLKAYIDSFDIVFVDSDDGMGLVNQLFEFFNMNPDQAVGTGAHHSREVIFEKSEDKIEPLLDQILAHVQVFDSNHQ